MARPRAKELTERELELMQVFWEVGEATAADVRDALSNQGRELTYPTVANLVRHLCRKGFLRPTNDARPFRYGPARSFDEVSGSLLRDLTQRVFGGSREKLLVRLMEEKKLTRKERAALKKLVKEWGQ